MRETGELRIDCDVADASVRRRCRAAIIYGVVTAEVTIVRAIEINDAIVEITKTGSSVVHTRGVSGDGAVIKRAG